MCEQVIQDWLADSKALSPGEVSSFASSLKHNNELIHAIFLVLDKHQKFQNIIEPISKQLFNYYRSKEFDLKLFTLQFLPNLIYIYLNSVARGDKKTCHSVETLLIGVYNLEVVDDAGQPVVISFRLPSLAQASLYHDPMSLAHVSLTETALRRLEECNTKLISWGPHPQVETLNAQNRLSIITKLLFVYNKHIASFNKLSLKYLCKVASGLASQGFGDSMLKSNSPRAEGSKIERLTRIPVSFEFFLELLCGLYFAIYNDFSRLALQAVDDIYNRSCYECFASVMAVANAIKNSSQISATDHERDGAMGISVALSPATTTLTTINKFMITNASFRTKKLPDDIPIIQKEESNASTGVAQKSLTSIMEEKDEAGFSVRGTSIRSKEAVAKNLQKLGLVKKNKEKDGRSASKSNLLTNTIGTDKKQSTLLQLSSFKEKAPVKSNVVQHNGDFSSTEIVGHKSLPPAGKSRSTENELEMEDLTNSLPEVDSVNTDFENQLKSIDEIAETSCNRNVCVTNKC